MGDADVRAQAVCLSVSDIDNVMREEEERGYVCMYVHGDIDWEKKKKKRKKEKRYRESRVVMISRDNQIVPVPVPMSRLSSYPSVVEKFCIYKRLKYTKRQPGV